MTTTSLKSGSTIDVNSLVNSLMKVESRPLTSIQARIDAANVSISAMAELRAKVDTLYSSALGLEDPFMLGGKVATSTDSSVATVSVTSGTLASRGTVTASVSILATAQRSTFSGFTSATAQTTFAGTFSVTFSGTMQAASFFSGSSSSASLSNTLSVSLAGKSLDNIRDAINNDASNNGRVIASIVKTGFPASGTNDDYALVLTSTKTGSEATFSSLWSQSSQDTAIVGPGGVRQGPNAIPGYDVAAADAVATIAGIQVRSASNTFSTAVPGLNITASKTGVTSIQVADNTAKIKELLNKFATAYTDLIRHVRVQTKPGSATESAGPLSGNSGVLALSTAMNTAYYRGISIAQSTTAYWSDLGLDVARDGTVSFNETTFSNFMATNNGISMQSAGFTSSLRTTLATYKGVTGTLESATDTMRSGISSLNDRKSEVEKRLDRLRASYVAKYSALDSKLSQMNFLNQSVSSSLARINKNDA